MTRISDQVDIFRQCSPIDLQPGSLPFLKPCSYFFITHIHAELVRFAVDCNNISVYPSRTRTNIRMSMKVDLSWHPLKIEEGGVVCVLA